MSKILTHGNSHISSGENFLGPLLLNISCATVEAETSNAGLSLKLVRSVPGRIDSTCGMAIVLACLSCVAKWPVTSTARVCFNHFKPKPYLCSAAKPTNYLPCTLSLLRGLSNLQCEISVTNDICAIHILLFIHVFHNRFSKLLLRLCVVFSL